MTEVLAVASDDMSSADEYWHNGLRLAGYHLRARILDYPEACQAMPGSS